MPIRAAVLGFAEAVRDEVRPAVCESGKASANLPETDQTRLSTILDELDALAIVADSENTTFRDFEDLRTRLANLGVFVEPKRTMAVADAFRGAGKLHQRSRSRTQLLGLSVQ